MSEQLTLSDIKESIEDVFGHFQQGLNGERASEMNKAREQAAAKVAQLDFPTLKHEEWKYTNVRKLVAEPFALSEETPSSLKKEDIFPFTIDGLEAHLLVFINGKYAESLSTIGDEAGLEVSNLAEAYHANAEVIDAHFAKYADFQQDIFAAMSTAFGMDGAFVRVKKGKAIEKPVMLLNVVDARTESVMAQPRHLVVVEENAQLTLIEDHVTLGTHTAFINMVSEMVVEKSGMLRHYKLQNKSANTSFVGTTQVEQFDTSHYDNTTVTLGGGLIRNNLNIRLNGEHCEAFMNGLYMLKDQHHVDNHTTVDHMKPNSYSDQLYKGILDGKSTGVFNGKIFVRKYAQKTNAFQSNKNILLSDGATIDTKPQLEIWADDVKCSHGATTGALDEEPLFYLRSRGIGEKKAKAMLMHAFAADVIDRMKVKPYVDFISELIEKRLEEGDGE